MHARRYAGPPLPAHGHARARRWDGWVGPAARSSPRAFKIGVTEFARVFQNRALRGKPNLMLNRMGGGAATANFKPLGKSTPQTGRTKAWYLFFASMSHFVALSVTIHHWNSRLPGMEFGGL